ncbi:actin cytoskeleton-regulatory complex protein End3p [Monosporozyma unispora]
MPKLEQFEIKKYWQIFSGLKPVDQKVSHDQVLPILYNSKQDSSVLNKIWFLADIDDDDNLDFEEFVICMRLIFDMVNKNIDTVPDELPDWLVPGSKVKLVKERKQTKAKENESLPPQKEPPKVDWYISPEDMTSYNKIVDTCTRANDGTMTFPSLSLSIKNKFFNIGSSDMDKVWKLVNPRSLNSIDKDPALYFVHILRQRNDVGSLIPAEVPKNLEVVFNKQPIQYDLKSEQAEVKRTTVPVEQPKPASVVTSSTITSSHNPLSNDLKIDTNNMTIDKARLIKEQLQGLLKYKQDKYIYGKDIATSGSNYNLQSFTDDLDNIEQQVNELAGYLSHKKDELNSLNNEINNTSS